MEQRGKGLEAKQEEGGEKSRRRSEKKERS